jgi:lipid A 3-O-deacylase
VKAYLPALLLMTAAAPANAGEIFGGLYLHDVDTPLSKSGIESGVDVHLGYRWDPIGGERGVQPYAFAAVNSAGNTHYAAAGVSYKFGDQIYFRPGLGLAVHTGSAKDFQDPTNDKIDFGSRILFAPEVALGARLNDRMSLEASWVHLSHAQVFGRQNPGMDVIGARLNWKM